MTTCPTLKVRWGGLLSRGSGLCPKYPFLSLNLNTSTAGHSPVRSGPAVAQSTSRSCSSRRHQACSSRAVIVCILSSDSDTALHCELWCDSVTLLCYLPGLEPEPTGPDLGCLADQLPDGEGAVGLGGAHVVGEQQLQRHARHNQRKLQMAYSLLYTGKLQYLDMLSLQQWHLLSVIGPSRSLHRCVLQPGSGSAGPGLHTNRTPSPPRLSALPSTSLCCLNLSLF